MALKALFLDRDGVINIDKEYVSKEEDVEFVDGIFKLCERFVKKGFTIFVVTNQSGIARGYFTLKEFELLSDWMQSVFTEHKAPIEKIYFCPHHPDFNGECNCRKPRPGMLLQAQKEYDINMQESVLIGDSERDIQAAIAAGVGRHYLLAPTQKNTAANGGCISHLEEIR